MATVYKVTGPPGTGKTSFLLDRVNDYLKNGFGMLSNFVGVPPERIAFCSFTNNAANEARHRAMRQFPYPAVKFKYFRTEHSICFRLLAEKAGLTRQNIFTGRHKRQFAEAFHYDLTSDDDNMGSRFAEAMLTTLPDYYEFFINWMKNVMLPFESAYRTFCSSTILPNGWSREGLVKYIDHRNKFKTERSLWDFNDLIYGCMERELYPDVDVLIADEGQDMSPLLFELVRRISERAKKTYIAADFLQCLYSWNGAAPELFLSFPCDEEITLRKSYRLPALVKDYAIRVVSRTGLPVPQFDPKDERGEVRFDVFDPAYLGGDAFILCRTRFQVSKFYDLLIDHGVPFHCERVRENPIFTSKGKAFLAVKKIRDGEAIGLPEIQAICEHTTKPFIERGTKTRAREFLDGEYRKLHLVSFGFTDEFFRHDADDILCQKVEEGEKVYLSRVYKKYGRGGFGESNITLTTQHGAKGSEREVVVIMPDLTRRIYDSYTLNERDETLLAYTSVTRASKKAIILLAESPYSFDYPRVKGKEG
jgi:superfamily I DNA/RNA helicase